MSRFKFIKLLFVVLIIISCQQAQTSTLSENNTLLTTRSWSFSIDEDIQRTAASSNWIAIEDDFEVTALDAVSGNLLWKKEFLLDVDSLPLFSSDLLAIATNDQVKVFQRTGNEIAVLDLDTNEENTKLVAFYYPYIFVVRTSSWVLDVYEIELNSKLWELPIGRGGVDISFDTSTHIVYVTTLSFIGGYDVANGNAIWQIDKKASTSTYDTGTLFIFEKTKDEMHYFTAFNASNSDELWRVGFSPSIRTEVYNLTILGDNLIAATNYGLVAMEKANGKQIWKSETDDKFSTSPVMLDNNIYARGTTSRTIYEISPKDGRYLGSIKLDEPPFLAIPDYEFYSALTVSGKLLIFTYGNTVFAYEMGNL